jgi:hypothetical protein
MTIKHSTRRCSIRLASSASNKIFREVQRLPLRRVGVAVAIPPLSMSALLVWQVILGHSWGKQPMSNGNVIGWTIFLWLIYLRLITVRLVTEVRGGQLIVSMRGLWRSRRVPLSSIQSVEMITFDGARDFGGYGIRSNRDGKAYLAGTNRGVRISLASGEKLTIGSARPEELAQAL